LERADEKGLCRYPEGQIHYRAEGSGKSLLLLHKASLSSDEYTELLPLLSKNHRTIAVDALGCGESDQPLFVPAIEDYARNIIHFMDALKIAKTILSDASSARRSAWKWRYHIRTY